MRVIEIRRCPVKSMQGETPAEVILDATGVVGDRAYALLDRETGAVASAKDPRRWGALFGLSARFSAQPGPGQPVTITLPGGTEVSSTDPDVVPGAGVFACLGAYANVGQGGTISVGDTVELR